MTKLNLQLTLSILVFSAIFITCNSPSQKVENAHEKLYEAKVELEEAKADSIEDYEAFKKESEARIERNEKLIKEINEKIKSVSKSYNTEEQKIIDNLEQKNTAMRVKVQEFKLSSKESWLDFKAEFNHDMDELGTAIKNITTKNIK